MEAPAGCGLGGAMFRLPGMLDGLLQRHGAMLPRGAEDEILLIKRDMEEIIAILKGLPVDGRSTMSVSCWTKEVRELSYDMEDFIDEYEHVRSRPPTPRRNRKVTRRWRRGSTNSPYWLREQLRQRLWMANKIREFSVRAQEAIGRHNEYKLGSVAPNASGATRADVSSSSSWQPAVDASSSSPWQPAPSWHDDMLIGIDATMDKLEEWLMPIHGEEHQKLRVVSVVGPGGVGKTTLANELYLKLGQRFECQAFVRTSQRPDMRKLFINMLSQLAPHQTPHDWNVHSLISIIRSHLQYKRYLIVLDDLWCTSQWEIIQCALPDGNSCSRILTMTEVEDLALHSCGYEPKYLLKMTPLGEDESRKLFFFSVFGPQFECPPELREVSYDIIRKCSGLPLAIVMVASLLACQKETQEQWNHVNKSLGYSLITNPTSKGMKQVLSLSYNSLPEHLKACMLYMSIYQEDNIIWKADLVNQWTAERFICALQGQDEQEIAAAYFDELVSRKIIQPVDIKDDGEVLSCIVRRTVLNHIAAHKSIEENFVTAIHSSQTTTILADKIRRLSLHFGNVEDAIPPENMRLSQVRTIAFFGVFKCMPSVMEFRLLQVLILHFWGHKDIISLDLTRISELFRLRYLKVTSNVTLELKTQMQGLKKLETVKIDAKVCVIPPEITRLIGLLHLSFPAETDLPNGISHITSLRTLGHFDISSNSIENIQSLSKLSNLRDLQLACSTKQPDLNKKIHCLLTSILEKLNNLKSLTLLHTASSYANSLDQSDAAGITISSDDISNAFNTLALLHRFVFSPHICIFSFLPKCIGQLSNLRILKIGIGKMVNDCVDVLKGLPALSVLSLYVHYRPAEMIVIGKEGFPVLKYFKLRCCDPMLKFEADAMPNLRKLTLGFNVQRVDQQVTIPLGIEHLSDLKEVYAKIGGAGYEESGRRVTELAFKDAMRVHGICCRVIVTCVNKIFGSKEDQSSALREEHASLKQPWDVHLLDLKILDSKEDQSSALQEEHASLKQPWGVHLLDLKKILDSKEGQSSAPREEHATLKQCKIEEVSDELDQIMEDPVKEAVDHANSRFMLFEWNILLLLRNKLDNQNDDITSGIPVVDPYSMDPWMLPGEPRYYFRPLQEVKVDIPAPSGYWRQIGPTRYIYSAKRQPIGMVRTMEFYQGTASGTRTTWKMKEFEALPEATVGAIDARLKERAKMSLCQLYIEELNTISVEPSEKSELSDVESYRALQNFTETNTQAVSKALRRADVADDALRLFKSSKERKVTKTVTVSVNSVSGVMPDDSYSWRKYGQKDVFGAKHPRSYYRCTHRNSSGCMAIKHVQRTDKDPKFFKVVYSGEHTCLRNRNQANELLLADLDHFSTGHLESP